jgi:DNA polymerase
MSNEKQNIIDKAEKCLKFIRDYKSYTIYKDDIPEANSGADIFLPAAGTEEIPVVKEYSGNITYKNESPAVHEKIISENIIDTNIKTQNDKWQKCNSLDTFKKEISDCGKCRNLSETRTQIVFGYGNPDADIVVVGEAPGSEEDKTGSPFVGRAGKLLTDILRAINLEREDIYICNILKCRPPENRNPEPEEIANCEPYLFKQLELIKPVLILAVGTFAAQTLLKSKEPLGKLRGKFHLYKGIKMMVTYHPAALLRNPNWKKPTWEDVQLFRKEYDSIIKSGK